jgi:hypothetical protein
MIDEEVKKIVQRNYDRTETIVRENRQHLEMIAKLLLEKEALSSDEINAVLGKTPAKTGRGAYAKENAGETAAPPAETANPPAPPSNPGQT